VRTFWPSSARIGRGSIDLFHGLVGVDRYVGASAPRKGDAKVEDRLSGLVRLAARLSGMSAPKG
jgi:hypothetical protein